MLNPQQRINRDIARAARANSAALRKALRQMEKGAVLFLPAKWPAKYAELMTPPDNHRLKRVALYPTTHLTAAIIQSGQVMPMSETSEPGSEVPSVHELGLQTRLGTYYALKPLTQRTNRSMEVEKNIDPQETDALRWARAFVLTVQALPTLPLSEETMLPWFATAICAGYDQARRDQLPAVSTLGLREANILQARNRDLHIHYGDKTDLQIRTTNGKRVEFITAARIEGL